MVWVRRLDRQTALNDLVFEVGKLVAAESEGSTDTQPPEMGKDVKLYGGSESVYLYMQWRRKEFNSTEVWGVAYANLPYWLFDDFATLNNRMAWSEINNALDPPPMNRDSPPLL